MIGSSEVVHGSTDVSWSFVTDRVARTSPTHIDNVKLGVALVVISVEWTNLQVPSVSIGYFIQVVHPDEGLPGTTGAIKAAETVPGQIVPMVGIPYSRTRNYDVFGLKLRPGLSSDEVIISQIEILFAIIVKETHSVTYQYCKEKESKGTHRK